MASQSSPTLLDLSAELIHKICRHLSFSDLLRLIFTCRRTHDLLKSDMCLWRSLQYPLFLNRYVDRNIELINSMMMSSIFSYCTILRVIKRNGNEEGEECIPTPFFSYLLPALAHQLKELSLQHKFDDDPYKYYSSSSSVCSR